MFLENILNKHIFTSLLLRQPPNLLLFVADQMRADHLGFYGITVVRTPNIDGIAVTGLQFNKFSL